MTRAIDTLLVGSGINSLVCAAMLAKQGHRVHVLERENMLGGCIRTEALTAPGYLHDTLSAAHPLFVAGPAYAALGADLHATGLSYCNTQSPTAVLLPDGRHLVLRNARQDNITQFETLAAGDGQAYAQAMSALEGNAELIFTLLGQELWSAAVFTTLAKKVWKSGLQPTSAFAGQSLQSARAWLETNFKSELIHALLAPWVLHCGLGPESAMSGLMAQVVAFTLEAVGMPMVEGGNAQTVRAFQTLIEKHGGSFQCNADVAHVILKQGKAIGVTLSSGESLYARHVVCNVTPTQLYTRLIPQDQCPPAIRQQAQAYRYGKGNMQIHLALSEMPQWSAPALGDVAYVHLTPGLNGVAKAVDEAQRGMLPAEGTIVVGQPSALDASRAPAGGCVLWIQLPECPRHIAGDAAGLIDTPTDGAWTEAVREAYANRIIARLALHIPNLERSVVGRKVISPADLEKLNINLVGGDPYSGECSLDQFLMWRPLPGVKNHETPFKNLWHIGASTHPGPGLGGVSGLHVAQHLAKS